MSRVHDALRRAEMAGGPDRPGGLPRHGCRRAAASESKRVEYLAIPADRRLRCIRIRAGSVDAAGSARCTPFRPAPESHLLDLNSSHETPAEEFRTLRTRLNHLQTLQPLHTIVVTSPSPAEGKTFSAVNLALAQSHLAETAVLLADFDLRRPIIHNLFQIDRAPGLSDYPDRTVHVPARPCAASRA